MIGPNPYPYPYKFCTPLNHLNKPYRTKEDGSNFNRSSSSSKKNSSKKNSKKNSKRISNVRHYEGEEEDIVKGATTTRAITTMVPPEFKSNQIESILCGESYQSSCLNIITVLHITLSLLGDQVHE